MFKGSCPLGAPCAGSCLCPSGEELRREVGVVERDDQREAVVVESGTEPARSR